MYLFPLLNYIFVNSYCNKIEVCMYAHCRTIFLLTVIAVSLKFVCISIVKPYFPISNFIMYCEKIYWQKFLRSYLKNLNWIQTESEKECFTGQEFLRFAYTSEKFITVSKSHRIKILFVKLPAVQNEVINKQIEVKKNLFL